MVAVSALRLVKVRAVRTTRVPLEAPSPSRLLPLELLLRPPPTALRRPPARETKVQAREQHVCLRLSHTAHVGFFCQSSVVLVPLRFQMEGNRPKGITAVLKAPVGLAGGSLGPLSSQPEAEGQRPLA